jgi:microcystin-dependent protein
MSDPYYGEIRMFAGNYAPLNWALCDGQLVNVSDNNALFSLLGTLYGGNGSTTFGLPDLRGRLPVHQGQGPGLTNRPLGQSYGAETASVTTAQIPGHTHPLQASTNPATAAAPSPTLVLAAAVAPDEIYASTTDQTKINKLADAAVLATGGDQTHSNLMPALCLSFIICLLGIYPERS